MENDSRDAALVLLIEDDADGRELLAHAIRQAGFAVAEATDGRDAIGVLSHLDAPPFVILSDIEMPNLDGLQFADWKELQPSLQGVPMVAITGDPTRVRGSGRRFVACFPKPCPEDKILLLLRALARSVRDPAGRG